MQNDITFPFRFLPSLEFFLPPWLVSRDDVKIVAQIATINEDDRICVHVWAMFGFDRTLHFVTEFFLYMERPNEVDIDTLSNTIICAILEESTFTNGLAALLNQGHSNHPIPVSPPTMSNIPHC